MHAYELLFLYYSFLALTFHKNNWNGECIIHAVEISIKLHCYAILALLTVCHAKWKWNKLYSIIFIVGLTNSNNISVAKYVLPLKIIMKSLSFLNFLLTMLILDTFIPSRSYVDRSRCFILISWDVVNFLTKP